MKCEYCGKPAEGRVHGIKVCQSAECIRRALMAKPQTPGEKR